MTDKKFDIFFFLHVKMYNLTLWPLFFIYMNTAIKNNYICKWCIFDRLGVFLYIVILLQNINTIHCF